MTTKGATWFEAPSSRENGFNVIVNDPELTFIMGRTITILVLLVVSIPNNELAGKGTLLEGNIRYQQYNDGRIIKGNSTLYQYRLLTYDDRYWLKVHANTKLNKNVIGIYESWYDGTNTYTTNPPIDNENTKPLVISSKGFPQGTNGDGQIVWLAHCAIPGSISSDTLRMLSPLADLKLSDKISIKNRKFEEQEPAKSKRIEILIPLKAVKSWKKEVGRNTEPVNPGLIRGNKVLWSEYSAVNVTNVEQRLFAREFRFEGYELLGSGRPKVSVVFEGTTTNIHLGIPRSKHLALKPVESGTFATSDHRFSERLLGSAVRYKTTDQIYFDESTPRLQRLVSARRQELLAQAKNFPSSPSSAADRAVVTIVLCVLIVLPIAVVGCKKHKGKRSKRKGVRS